MARIPTGKVRATSGASICGVPRRGECYGRRARKGVRLFTDLPPVCPLFAGRRRRSRGLEMVSNAVKSPPRRRGDRRHPPRGGMWALGPGYRGRHQRRFPAAECSSCSSRRTRRRPAARRRAGAGPRQRAGRLHGGLISVRAREGPRIGVPGALTGVGGGYAPRRWCLRPPPQWRYAKGLRVLASKTTRRSESRRRLADAWRGCCTTGGRRSADARSSAVKGRAAVSSRTSACRHRGYRWASAAAVAGRAGGALTIAAVTRKK